MNTESMSDHELLSDFLKMEIPKEAKLHDILESPLIFCTERTERNLQKLRAAEEIMRRLVTSYDVPKNLDDVPEYLIRRYRYETKEIFSVIILDEDWNVLAIPEIAIGLLDTVTIAGREIYREVLKYPAKYIMTVHNHPSGGPEPSDIDFRMTEKLCCDGYTMGILIVDAIVIGDGTYVSMDDEGLFDFERMVAVKKKEEN